jgi:hypothetical protein
VSRYELPSALPAGDRIEVVVGWDPPLKTFFAQVWDRTKDEDEPGAELLWIGCSPRELNDVQQVMDAVAPWAKMPDPVKRALYRDAS